MVLVLDCVAQPVWVVDHDGLIRFANPSAVAAPGYASAAEVHGKPSHQTIHYKRPDGSPFPIEECPIAQCRATGEPVRAEDCWVRKGGSMMPVTYTAVPFEAPTGYSIAVSFAGLTARRAAEQAVRGRAVAAARVAELSAGEARHRAILEAAIDGVISINEQGRLTYVNSDRDAQRAAGHDRRRLMAASAFAEGTGAGMRVLAASASSRAAADSIHRGKCADPLLQQAARKLRAPAGPVRLQQPRRTPDKDCRLPDQAHVTEFPGGAPHQPGGPGGSGLDLNVFLIGTFKAEHLGAAASGYGWIGFDPRGVGSSVSAPTRVVMFCRLNVSPVDTPRWRRIPPVGRARHESRSPHSGGGGLRTARGSYPSGGELRLGGVRNARALDEGTEQIEVGA